MIDYLTGWYHSEIVEIDLARKSIRRQVYGTCRSCNQPIDLRWLEAFAETELCRRCQSVGDGAGAERHDPHHNPRMHRS